MRSNNSLVCDFCIGNNKARGGGKNNNNKKEAKYNKKKSYTSKHIRIQENKKIKNS